MPPCACSFTPRRRETASIVPRIGGGSRPIGPPKLRLERHVGVAFGAMAPLVGRQSLDLGIVRASVGFILIRNVSLAGRRADKMSKLMDNAAGRKIVCRRIEARGDVDRGSRNPFDVVKAP